MQTLVDLVLGLSWPISIAFMFYLSIQYIDKMLKLKTPIADTRYNELIEAMKALRSDVNTMKIHQGFRRDEE